jgi:hypothetical protein
MSQVNLDKNNAYFLNLEGTGGWLQAAETEEKYVMTWTNSRNKTAVEENIFEMPTGGNHETRSKLSVFCSKNNV